MIECFFHRDDLNRPHQSQATETQEPPHARQVPEGHKEEKEDIDFNDDDILPGETTYR